MVSKSRELDPLESLLEILKAWSSSTAVPLVPGVLAKDADRMLVEFQELGAAGMERFLACARQIGATLIITNVQRLTQEELDEAREAHEQIDDDESRATALAELDRCVSSVGNIAMIELHAYSPSNRLLHRAFFAAEWFDLVYADGEDDDEFDSQESEDAEAEIEAIARTVAGRPEFANAKNLVDRELLVRRHLKQRADGAEFDAKEIAQLAGAIFKSDFLPTVEQRVLELRDSGRDVAGIAQELGISTQAVRRILR